MRVPFPSSSYAGDQALRAEMAIATLRVRNSV